VVTVSASALNAKPCLVTKADKNVLEEIDFEHQKESLVFGTHQKRNVIGG
jgi:hypothetical protein